MTIKIKLVWALFLCCSLSGFPVAVVAQELDDPACESAYEGYISDERLQSSTVDGQRLIGAAAGGDIAQVARLLKKGVSPNYSHPDLMTPLAWASRCGHLNVVKLLLMRGAKVNFPVSFAVNSRYRHKNSSALIWAASNDRVEVVRYLIESGADPRQQEKVYRLEMNSKGDEKEYFFELGRRASNVTENPRILSLLRGKAKTKSL